MMEEIIKLLLLLSISVPVLVYVRHVKNKMHSNSALAIAKNKEDYYKSEYSFTYGPNAFNAVMSALFVSALIGWSIYDGYDNERVWILELVFVVFIVWSFWLILASIIRRRITFEHDEMIIPSVFYPWLLNHRIKWGDITNIYLHHYNGQSCVFIERKMRFTLHVYINGLRATNAAGISVNAGKEFVRYVQNMLTGRRQKNSEAVALGKVEKCNVGSIDIGALEEAISQWVSERLVQKGAGVGSLDEWLEVLGSHHSAKYKENDYSIRYDYYPPDLVDDRAVIMIAVRRSVCLLGKRIFDRPVSSGDMFLSLMRSVAKEGERKFDILFEISV